jgi:hypothetical protein
VRDQVSHPHKLTGNIIGLYTLIFTFFRQQMGRQDILNRMVTSSLQI